MTTKDQDQDIKDTVLKMMRDLADDQNLSPKTITRQTLRLKKLDPQTIDEIMKLKNIYLEVEAGKPVDIKHIREELDEVIHELDEDVEEKKSQREIIQSKDHEEHLIHDSHIIRDLESHLPMTGMTTEKQDYEIKYEVTEIMRDLASDQSLNPEKVSKYSLKKMDLSPKTINEIMKLKQIYDEVASGKPVDIKHIREELDLVLDQIEAEEKADRAEKEEQKSLDNEILKKIDDERILKELESTCYLEVL